MTFDVGDNGLHFVGSAGKTMSEELQQFNDLATDRNGGKIIFATDDFFAVAENLINVIGLVNQIDFIMDIAAAKEVLTDPEKKAKFANGEDPLDPESGKYGGGGFPFNQGFHHFHGSPFQFKFHFS